jgi:hypothetical protein
MSKQNKIILHCIWIMLLIPLLAKAQGFAGPDRSLCIGGTTKLGCTSTCTDCCYLWSPEKGLDDPSKPNPTVSGLTKTQNYTVYISYPDGHYESDDVNVTVYEADVQIFHPNYFKINTLIPETEEKIPGAQSYVNLDNDDCDKDFDIDDIIIQGGDDEFIKMRVIMTIQQYNKPGSGGNNPDNGPSEYEAALDLAQGTAVSGLRFWKSNDKAAGEYFIGNPLVLTAVNGFPNMYETYIWAEGTEAHTIQQQVKLFARAYDDLEPACTDKFVGITIVGIEKVEWVGKQNGYTGDGKNNSNTLDPNPTGGVRVFPEGKEPIPSAIPKTSVGLRITLSVSAPVEQQLFVRPFDIDDPSEESVFVDPNDTKPTGKSGIYAGDAGLNYSLDNDNRGLGKSPPPTSSAKKEGVFTGANLTFLLLPANIGLYKVTIGKAKEVMLENFWVSQMCGDNYKVAVSHDQAFIKSTRNYDVFDGDKIVEICTAGLDNKCKSIPENLCSPMLTVWRTLHIENDRMRNPNWQDNKLFKGYFAGFDLHLNNCNEIYFIEKAILDFTPQLPTDQPLFDGSDFPGRFQDGILSIGDPASIIDCPPSPPSLPQPCIASNTPDELQFSGLLDLTSNGTLSGVVSNSVKGDFIFNVKDIEPLNPFNFDMKITMTTTVTGMNHYTGGDVSIGGGPFSKEGKVEFPDGPTDYFILREKSNPLDPINLLIPFEIADDDQIPMGGTSSIIKELDLAHAKQVYANVYIDVVNDGAGKLTNNRSVPFTPNIIYSPLDLNQYSGPRSISDYYSSYCNHRNMMSNNYWCAYFLSAWQTITTADQDPGIEYTFGAITLHSPTNLLAGQDDCLLSKGSSMVAYFWEAMHDYNPDWARFIPTHEIGHIFGLSHGNDYNSNINSPNTCLGIADLSEIGIMDTGYGTAGSVSTNIFIPYHINILRSRINSPGK